jgi:hypothetical protein
MPDDVNHSVSLAVRRNEGESWRECALRHAEPYGLTQEIAFGYDAAIMAGVAAPDACFLACYEWDVVPVVESTP